MSEYDSVSRGSLKLKSLPGVSKKSKKSKKKDKLARIERELVEKELAKDADDDQQQVQQHKPSGSATAGHNSWMTAAEKKFIAQQEKRQLSRVMDKATKSHKQRVEEFNTHLENLTEHYDIPKVSWTK